VEWILKRILVRILKWISGMNFDVNCDVTSVVNFVVHSDVNFVVKNK